MMGSELYAELFTELRSEALECLDGARRAARDGALDAGMRHLERSLPIFVRLCERTALGAHGASSRSCAYPTRDWFECWDDAQLTLHHDAVFRAQFVRRVEARHEDALHAALGAHRRVTVTVTVAWPTELRVVRLDGNGRRAASQVLEVIAEWAPADVGNYAGACKACQGHEGGARSESDGETRALALSRDVTGECKVCLNGDADDGDDDNAVGGGLILAALMPCGHMLCTACCNKICRQRAMCPICREQVHGVQRLFLP